MKKILFLLLLLPIMAVAAKMPRPLMGAWHLKPGQPGCTPAGTTGFVINQQSANGTYQHVRVIYESGVLYGDQLYLSKDEATGKYYFGPYKDTIIYGFELRDQKNRPIRDQNKLNDVAYLVGRSKNDYNRRCILQQL